MDQQPPTHNFLKNTAYSFLGYTFPIIFSILITPIIIRKLGIVDYGIFVLIITISGFLGLVDLGIGTALIKYASQYRAQNDELKLKGLVGSINLLFLIFGIFGLIVYFIIGKYCLSVFHISTQQQAHILPVFLLAGLVFFINSLIIIPSNLLRAWERYDLSTKISLSYLTAYNLSLLLLLFLGYKLKLIYLTIALLTFVAWLIYLNIAAKATRLKILHFAWNFEEVKRCYRFGLAAFVTNISNNTLAQLDRLVIPMYLSPVQLSYYAVPGNVAEKVSGVVGSSTSVLFPMLSSFTASGNKEQIAVIYKRVFRNIPVVALAMALSIALFADKILFYWVGPDFSKNSGKILIILAATNAILGLYGVLQNFLMGFGKVRFLMKSSLVMAALNVILLVILVPKQGTMGAAWAYLLSVAPIFFIFYWVETKFLKFENRSKYYAKLFGKLLITSALHSGLCLLVFRSWVMNLPSLILVGGSSVVLFLALYKILGFVEKDDWQTFIIFIKNIIRKFNPSKI